MQNLTNLTATISYGGKLRLECNTDGYYKGCKFIQRGEPSNNVCDFQWNKDAWNITTFNCSDFGDRARFVGDYNSYECGMELDHVKPEGIKSNLVICFDAIFRPEEKY